MLSSNILHQAQLILLYDLNSISICLRSNWALIGGPAGPLPPEFSDFFIWKEHSKIQPRERTDNELQSHHFCHPPVPPLSPPTTFDRQLPSLNSLAAIRVLAGTKTPAPWDSYGRNSTESTAPPTQLFHKHHHHGKAICPSYGVGSVDPPDRMWAASSEGVGQERFGLV